MTRRRHWTTVALISGLALVAAGCGGDDSDDATTDDATEATTSVDDSADDTADEAEDEDAGDDSGDDSGGDDAAAAGSGATVPEGADALAILDIDGVGSYEIPLTSSELACFVSDETVTISGDGPNGEDASLDYTASLDATSVYVFVPDDGVQVGAGGAAISGDDPVEITVSGDSVTGSGVFVALDGSGEYEGTFEFVCGQ